MLPRHLGLCAAALLLAGCADPATTAPDELPFLPPFAPSGWSPMEGVSWGNLTGSVDPGECHTFDGFAPAPVIVSWWLRAEPNVTLAIANWTPGARTDTLCAHLNETDRVRIVRDVQRTNASEEMASGQEGHAFAFWCEAEVACEIRWWSQQIRPVNEANGTRRWPASAGPAPAGYDA